MDCRASYAASCYERTRQEDKTVLEHPVKHSNMAKGKAPDAVVVLVITANEQLV